MPALKPQFSPALTRHCQNGLGLIDNLSFLIIVSLMCLWTWPHAQQQLAVLRCQYAAWQWQQDFYFSQAQARSQQSSLALEKTNTCSESTLALGNWSCGWRVIDTNRSLVLHTRSLPARVRILVSPSLDHIQFNSLGQAQTGGLRVVFTLPNYISASYATSLCINNVGRIRRISGLSCS